MRGNHQQEGTQGNQLGVGTLQVVAQWGTPVQVVGGGNQSKVVEVGTQRQVDRQGLEEGGHGWDVPEREREQCIPVKFFATLLVFTQNPKRCRFSRQIDTT